MSDIIKSPTLKSAREFDAVAGSMKRGQILIYHTGLLMRDRQANETVNSIASRAWSAMEAGDLTLVQRRASAGVCDYFAVRL